MPETLTLQLINHTTTSDAWAYITGLALRSSNRRIILDSTGQPYYPANPPRILQPIPVDCAIPLGPPGNITTLTLPQIAGGRIWFSVHKKLTFLLNPGGPGGGAALVEPSVLNPSDPNASVDFSFCEFTLNDAQLFANISYVDFVPRLPISLTLQRMSGEVQHVSGMAPDGLERVAEGLRAQTRRDGKPWDKLVVVSKEDGRPLRALAPTHGGAVGASFEGYFEPLVEKAWESRETGSLLRINTQAGPGVVGGKVEGDQMVIGGEKFSRPTTADILGCNSGPFTTGPSPTRNAIIPRLAAAFQRGCICDVEEHPSHPETFYKCESTNHYCRIVHECNLDGKGYAFAYDDVQPDGGEDQSGKVNAGDPKVFIVAVGGAGAYVGDRLPY
ncbi:glucanase b [Cercophora newfieldiana]|uniref:Glucanase b n=1 Tax=Cercophora newfieldiana TaxID=92897 RepID=A0AA39YIP3_9PEZI|nr:glucanase b [Cercophora newfieldiana]